MMVLLMNTMVCVGGGYLGRPGCLRRQNQMGCWMIPGRLQKVKLRLTWSCIDRPLQHSGWVSGGGVVTESLGVQAFTITTLQTIAIGAQVYDSYGQKCNHRFLLNYGFAIENNREADGFCPNEVR
jgi:hypothetical protein